LRTGWANDGDESVNADAGAEDAATIIVAPARAAARPPGMRRERMFSSDLPPRRTKRARAELGWEFARNLGSLTTRASPKALRD